MTSVIGHEDNGWTSATMDNGKLIEQHRDRVQDIHQHAMHRPCKTYGPSSEITPEMAKQLLDEGIELQKKLEPRIKAMQCPGISQKCGPGLCGTYSTCQDCGRSPYPKWASPVRRIDEEKSMLKELNKPYPVPQVLNHVESHIILDILKKQSLTLSQLVRCDQLSNVSAKAVETAVNYLIGRGRITLGADSILQVIAESQPVQSATATSPKTLDSSHKIPVNLCPASAIIAIALVIAQGHKKPGRTIYNWRDKNQKISYMDYHAAALRHLLKSIDGSDFDQELSELAGVSVRHDWAAMSCLAILEDARQAGTLVDDRPTKGGAEEFLDKLTVKK